MTWIIDDQSGCNAFSPYSSRSNIALPRPHDIIRLGFYQRGTDYHSSSYAKGCLIMSKQQKGLSKAAGVLASLAFIAVAVVMALPILNLVIAFELLFSPAAKYAVVACVPLSGAAIGAWMLRKRRPHDLPDAAHHLARGGRF